MDANETLYRLVSAAAAGDVETVREAADNLSTWIARGGFAPALKSLVRTLCERDELHCYGL